VLERLLRDALPPPALSRLSGRSRIFLVGTGTSYHGALVGQYLMRSAGVDAWAIPAFEFVNYPPRIKADDGLLLLSHRGTKRFSQAALDAFDNRDHWLAITGEGSPLRGPGVITTVAQERSPVHTASHTGAMVRLAQLALAVGSPPWEVELARVPGAIRAALALRPQVIQAMDRVHFRRVVHFVGGGPAYATALEGALKLREAAYVSTEGHDVESILHGPLISLNAARRQPGADRGADGGAPRDRDAHACGRSRRCRLDRHHGSPGDAGDRRAVSSDRQRRPTAVPGAGGVSSPGCRRG